MENCNNNTILNNSETLSGNTVYGIYLNGSDDNDGRTAQFPLRTIKKAAKIATDGDDQI